MREWAHTYCGSKASRVRAARLINFLMVMKSTGA
jgi:hypothetical protein